MVERWRREGAVITGATGQIGRPLSQRLVEAGYEVAVLSRRPEVAPELVPGAVDHLAWEPDLAGGWAAALDGADGLIRSIAGPLFYRRFTEGVPPTRTMAGRCVQRALVPLQPASTGTGEWARQ